METEPATQRHRRSNSATNLERILSIDHASHSSYSAGNGHHHHHHHRITRQQRVSLSRNHFAYNSVLRWYSDFRGSFCKSCLRCYDCIRYLLTFSPYSVPVVAQLSSAEMSMYIPVCSVFSQFCCF